MVSRGHPGTLNIIRQLPTERVEAFWHMLEGTNLSGPQIWTVYSACEGEGPAKLADFEVKILDTAFVQEVLEREHML